VDQLDEFLDLMRKSDLDAVVDRVRTAAKPGLHVAKEFDETVVPRRWLGLFPRRPRRVRRGRPCPIGASRIGGLPDVPAGFEWPMCGRHPARFLMQLRCADVAPFAAQTLLPRTGRIYFFVFEPFDEAGCVVYRDEGEVRPLPMPPVRRGEPGALPPFGVRFEPIPTFPDAETPEFEALGLDEEQTDLLFELMAQWNRARRDSETVDWGRIHQIGGTPSSVQGDVRFEWAETARRDRLRSPGPAQPDEAEVASWRLLLQFDTDSDLDVMWGDAGRLFFGLHEDDLRAARFERSVLVSQCY